MYLCLPGECVGDAYNQTCVCPDGKERAYCDTGTYTSFCTINVTYSLLLFERVNVACCIIEVTLKVVIV